MITSSRLSRLGAIILVSTTNVAAQTPDDRLSVETAAAVAMLKFKYSVGSIALDPMFARPSESPSVSTLRERPQARSDAIARAIQATVRREADVRPACPAGSRACRLSGVSALLTLSEPSISVDSATILGQIVQNSPSDRQPTDFETVVLTLRRSGGQWRVVSERQLGVS